MTAGTWTEAFERLHEAAITGAPVAELERLAAAELDELLRMETEGEDSAMASVDSGAGVGALGRPEVVTVCGSMRFFDRMLALASAETAAGCVVLAPFVVLAAEDQREQSEHKAMLDELHRRKIDMSDRVVVVTDEHRYLGPSTLAEIAYAHARRVPVEVLEMRRVGS